MPVISTAAEHSKILHDPAAARGLVTLATRQNNRWQEQRLKPADLPYFAKGMEGRADVYLTQNRFHGHRRVTQLAEADALFTDLDYYKIPDLRDLHPGFVLDKALDALTWAQIPEPTFAVSTGRGLALVWLHSPIPRAALSRWQACQTHLWKTLQPLGADRLCLDAARVLRLVGTINGKAGTFVEALANHHGDAWEFDLLADEILPLSRADLHDLRVHRALKKPQEPRRVAPHGFTAATLWEGRLSELQRLREHRWFGGLPPGQRDSWLFVAGVAVSWITPPAVLRRELYALAHEVGGWHEAEAKARLTCVFKRAEAAARGERVEWNGREVDPRYRFKTGTILEWLAISELEMRALKFRHLVTKDIDREQRAEKKRQARRNAGMMSRDDYTEKAAERRAEARRLREQGMSYRGIAKALGVSPEGVRKMLAADIVNSLSTP